MKTILITSDFSPYSKNAIRFAADYLSFSLRRMIILHAIYPSLQAKSTLIQLDDILREKSVRGLEADQAYALQLLPSTTVDIWTVSMANNLIEAVTDVMSQEEVDMIVMGVNPQPHGTNHLENDVQMNWAAVFKKPVLAVPMP